MRITTDTHLEYPKDTLYGAFRKAAEKAPRAMALDFNGKRYTFAALLKEIDKAAAALAKEGVTAADTVTICMPNMPQALILFYAASRIGARANMLHPQSALKEMQFALELTGSRFVLVLDMFYETMLAAARELERPVALLVTHTEDELPPAAAAAYSLTAGRRYAQFPYPGEGMLWKDFMREGKNAPEVPEAPFDPSHTGVILYSGGTTGTNKGVALSDYSFNCCARQAAVAIDEDFGPGATMLSCMPCFHGFGLGMNLHAALIHGVGCVLMPTFNIKTYAKLLLQKKPNFIAGVPSIFDALLNIPGMESADLSFLRGMFCGGDTLPIPLKERVDAFLSAHSARIQIREGYGLTESVTASCLTPRDEYRAGSIGLPFPDTAYAIVRPGTAELLPVGEVGEIIMTGPTLMQGYVGDDAETALQMKTFPDGTRWLYTGDLGCLDADGFVYFKGRIKRMIITNGYNVFPAELERVIEGTEGVRQACVVGVSDPRRGQKIKAYIVAEAGTELAALREAVTARLQLFVARYAQPRELLFPEALPLTPLGKIDYLALEKA